ncbi:hypothetical protein GQ54DRAFT_9905 [Martensiomyces pterosporus]|nr:hypothetical protein GQ54DRAFT_9905 [Martensiomyces pterosporus]
MHHSGSALIAVACPVRRSSRAIWHVCAAAVLMKEKGQKEGPEINSKRRAKRCLELALAGSFVFIIHSALGLYSIRVPYKIALSFWPSCFSTAIF